MILHKFRLKEDGIDELFHRHRILGLQKKTSRAFCKLNIAIKAILKIS